MFEKLKNSRFILALSIVLVVLAVTAGFVFSGITDAYFTDNDGESAGARTGKVGIALGNIETSFAESIDLVENIYWGTFSEFSFDIENNGNMAMDAVTTIKLESNADLDWEKFSEQFLIYRKDDVTFANGVYTVNEGAEPIDYRTVTEDGILITLPKETLSGSSYLEESQTAYRDAYGNVILGNEYKNLGAFEKLDYSACSDVKEMEFVFYFNDLDKAADLKFTVHVAAHKYGNMYGWGDSDEFVRFGNIAFNPYRNMLETGVDFNAHLMELAGVPTSSMSTYSADIPVMKDLSNYEKTKYNIYFRNEPIPEGVETVDVSFMKDGSVVAWAKTIGGGLNAEPGRVYVTAVDGGTIRANEDCSYMFTNWNGNVFIENFDSTITTDMSYMFWNAVASDLTEVETENVTTMAHMFDTTNIHNLVLTGWNTEKVEDMSYMFYDCSVGGDTTIDLTGLNTSNVTNMSYMFSVDKSYAFEPTFIVEGWNTGKVTTMAHMFENCAYKFSTLDFETWDVSNVEDMSYMMRNFVTYQANTWYDSDWKEISNLDFTAWNTGKVKYMQYMFADNSQAAPNTSQNAQDHGLQSLNVSGWNTANVEDFSHMFEGLNSVDTLDLSGWDTAKAKDMSYMFYRCCLPTTTWNIGITTLNISSFDTSNVENFAHMFDGCRILSNASFAPVDSWNTEKAKDMSYMFYNCQSITDLVLNNWSVSNVESMTYMFYNCNKLATINVSNWDTAKTKDMSYMFYNCQKATAINVGTWTSTSACTDMQYMFYYCYTITSLDVSAWDVANVQYMNSMFEKCSKLTSLNLASWNVSKVENMNRMFYYCAVLTTIGDAQFNSAKVTDIGEMFSYCKRLTSIDLSKMDTQNVIVANKIFYECNALQTLDVSGWNTLNFVDMSYMFYNCYNLTALDLSTWETDNTVDMSYMFYNCNSGNLNTINMSGWNTSKLKNMSYMFYKCTGLTTLNINHFDVSNVTDASYAFYNLPKVMVLDLSSWDFKQNFKADNMFYGACIEYNIARDGFRAIYAGDWTSKITSTGVVFNNSYALVGDHAAYNGLYSGKSMANPTTGYFSTKPVLIKNMLIPGYEFNSILPSNATSVIFTNVVDSTKTLTDLSALGDGSVVGWSDGSKYYVASTDGNKIIAHPISSDMFYYKYSLRTIDFTNLDTSRVKNMEYMFAYCQALTSVNTELLNTANNASARYMFAYASNIKNLNLNGWDMSNVSSAYGMFQSDSQLQTINGISNWNMGNCVTTGYMFYLCSELQVLDLSDWTFDSTLQKTDSMFNSCSKLSRIYGSNWTEIASPSSSTDMFYSCASYVSGAKTWVGAHTGNDGCFINKSVQKANTVAKGNAVKHIIPSAARTVIFDSQKAIPSGVNILDLSAAYDGSVVGWLDGTTFYITTTNSEELFLHEDCKNMFYARSSLTYIDFGDANGSFVQNINSMFESCSSLQSIANLDAINTSNVTSLDYVFYNCQSLLSLDLSSWDVSNVTSATCTFYECKRLAVIHAGDWTNTKAVTSSNSNYMFYNCSVLSGAVPYNSSKYAWDMANPTTGYFVTKTNQATNVLITGPELNVIIPAGVTGVVFTDSVDNSYQTTDLSALGDGSVVGWEGEGAVYYIAAVDGSKIIAPADMTSAFENKSYLTNVDFSNLDTSNTTSFARMFYNCGKLNNVNMELLDSSNIRTTYYMFYYCSSLTTLDLETWDMSKVTDAYGMFYYCGNLTTIYAGDWAANSTPLNSQQMFYGCSKLVGAIKYSSSKLGWGNANPTTGYFTEIIGDSNVIASGLSFADNIPSDATAVVFDRSLSKPSGVKTIDLSAEKDKSIIGWMDDTTLYVTSANGDTMYLTGSAKKMFYQNWKLQSIDFGDVDTSAVTDMSDMFSGCNALTSVNVSNFNTMNVTDMSRMFYACDTMTELNLSRFVVSNVQQATAMFFGCQSLQTIYAQDWTFMGAPSDSSMMFMMCSQLVGAVSYDSTALTWDMANTMSGYFSYY